MKNQRITALLAVGAMVIAFGGLATAVQAGAATYPVEVAANGGVGGCQSSTGTMSNVTHNTGASPITIYCPTPNGFAWGKMLDTPDEVVDATLVDDGSDVVGSWKQTGNNNSRGRKLGLAMRIGDMRVKNTELVFEDATDGAFTSEYDLLVSGKQSRRPNLKLRLPRGADLLSGTARCKGTGETAGVTWTPGTSARGAAYRAWTPQVLVDCSSLGTGTAFASNSFQMTPDPNNQKLLTGTATCSTGQAVAGGYDTSLSTTSQWPMVVLNGPEAPDANGVSRTWRVTVAVPSQNSASARAVMKVWVTCSK